VHSPWRTSIPFALCLGVSGLLLGIGFLITLAPEMGERAFGLHIEGNSYGFHYATGVRTAYFGLLIMLLTWLGQRRALALVLTTLAIAPLGDFLIVLASPGASFIAAAVHVPGIVILLGMGSYLRRSERGRGKKPRLS